MFPFRTQTDVKPIGSRQTTKAIRWGQVGQRCPGASHRSGEEGQAPFGDLGGSVRGSDMETNGGAGLNNWSGPSEAVIWRQELPAGSGSHHS